MIKSNIQIVREVFEEYGVKFSTSSHKDEQGRTTNHCWFYLGDKPKVFTYPATIVNQATLRKDVALILEGRV